jgi:hypothetical protein
MRFFQRQIDLVRKDTKDYQWVIVSAILVMLVLMDYMYFIDKKPI